MRGTIRIAKGNKGSNTRSNKGSRDTWLVLLSLQSIMAISHAHTIAEVRFGHILTVNHYQALCLCIHATACICYSWTLHAHTSCCILVDDELGSQAQQLGSQQKQCLLPCTSAVWQAACHCSTHRQLHLESKSYKHSWDRQRTA